jgi:hypothetical protein
MGVAAGDVDNDGNIDLYVANMYSKAGNRVISNVTPGTYPDEIMATLRSFVASSQLHRNLGVGATAQARDARQDLARVTGLSASASAVTVAAASESSPLFPQFEQLGQTWQVAGVGWAYGPAFVDLDNDGWLDIYATAGFMSQDRTKPDG